MNVTALLDVPAQRSVNPLDSAVGDDASDPAFANVMSRYQAGDNDSLAADASKPPTETNDDVPSEAVAPTNVANKAAGAEQASTAPGPDANASGDALPPPVIPDGQILPLLDAANPEAGLPGAIDHPKPDCELDATDPNAAALIAVAAPAPLPVPTTAGVAPVATAPLDPGAARAAADAPPMVATQGADAALAPDPDPAPAPLPIDPLRLTGKDGDAATLAIAANPVATVTDDGAARPGSASHALRALGLAHGQSPIANGSPNTGGGDARDPNGSSGDSRRDGAPKIANAHLAAALEAAAQKDPAAVHRDGSDSAIRTDASSRPNGPVEGARDIPTARLGDLAQQHAPRFAAELADRVLVLRSQRFDSATVSLEPRDLGRIDIQVRLQADTTHVAFTAQHAAVRDALEGQMPRLRALLEEAGLSLGNVDVSHSGNRGSGDPGASRAYSQPQASTAIDAGAQDSSTRWQRRVETSLIDLHA